MLCFDGRCVASATDCGLAQRELKPVSFSNTVLPNTSLHLELPAEGGDAPVGVLSLATGDAPGLSEIVISSVSDSYLSLHVRCSHRIRGTEFGVMGRDEVFLMMFH
eukprot:1017957-Pleurochrysis_carterae.AAC.1